MFLIRQCASTLHPRSRNGALNFLFQTKAEKRKTLKCCELSFFPFFKLCENVWVGKRLEEVKLAINVEFCSRFFYVWKDKRLEEVKFTV